MRLTLVTLVLSAMLAPAHAIDVTMCGTVVPEGDVGVLQVDLDCGVLPAGVTLRRSARLRLNGHTLRGGARAVLAEFARGSAWVDGPGTVTRAEIGIAGAGSVRSGRGIELHLTDVAVRDNGIGVFADRLRLTRVTAEGNRDGIASNYRMKGDDVLANDNAQFGV